MKDKLPTRKIKQNKNKKYLFTYLPPYTTPASLSEPYVTAIPIPKIPKAKKPGTKLRTVAPQDAALYSAPLVTAAVFTSVDIGPTRDTPIRILTNPPINLEIIFNYVLFPPRKK